MLGSFGCDACVLEDAKIGGLTDIIALVPYCRFHYLTATILPHESRLISLY